MKQLLLSLLLFINSVFSFAHPGIGIVKDSKGNIYYTDLKQVWKVDAITGKKVIAVHNVHTHELYMDANDNLYGEHLWYNGEKLNTWGHYVWCLKNNGVLAKIIEPTEGFLSNYSFVRDSAGNMYWVERFTTNRFMKKTPSGKITKIAEEKSGFIGWLYSTSNGTLYFTEGNNLKKLTADGTIVLLSGNLGSKTTGFTFEGRNYDGYGIWTDDANNLYIAMIDEKKVNRISGDGKVQTILFANSLWTPCSGLFDKKGNLWLLEYSITNECRARKVAKEELSSMSSSKPFTRKIHVIATIITALGIVLSWLLLRVVINNHKLKLEKQFA
jgi:hypothetical protein